MSSDDAPHGDPFRLAVVGVGVMGRNHARAASELPETELAAVVDADLDAARAVAALHGAPTRSLDDVLADDTLDGIVVATPTVTHVDIASRALDAGKHVLVEKPMASTATEAETLVNLASKVGRTLAVGHIERHNPAVGYVKNALGDGRYGSLIHVAARRVSRMPGRIRDVGCILDLGVHDLDAVMHLVGRAPERVHATAGTFTEGLEFEDHAAILLTFPGAVTSVVEVNWLTPMKVRQVSLTASEGYVELDYINQSVRVSRSRYADVDQDNLFRVPLELTTETNTLQRREPLKLELRDFARAARDGSDPLVTGTDGVGVLRVAEAALESARTGDAVRL